MRLDSIYTGIHRPNSTLPANVNDPPALRRRRNAPLPARTLHSNS
jgi:hypothetical protein